MSTLAQTTEDKAGRQAGTKVCKQLKQVTESCGEMCKAWYGMRTNFVGQNRATHKREEDAHALIATIAAEVMEYSDIVKYAEVK